MFGPINIPRICHICNRVRITNRLISSKVNVPDSSSTVQDSRQPKPGPSHYSQTRTSRKPSVRAGKRAFLNQYEYGNANANANTKAKTNTLKEVKLEDTQEECSSWDIPVKDQAIANGDGHWQSKGKMINSVSTPTPTPIPLRRNQEDDIVSSSQMSDEDKSQVKFIGIDLETSLPKIFTTKLSIYRCPLFNLRAFPSHLLPPRRPPPFPDFQQTSTRMTWAGRCVYLSVISSKAQVSKLAVERNRARRRLKAVFEGVVHGQLGGLRKKGSELVTPEYAYVVSVTAAIHDAPHEEIITQVMEGLKHLKRVQPWRNSRGVGQLKLPEPRYIYSHASAE